MKKGRRDFIGTCSSAALGVGAAAWYRGGGTPGSRELESGRGEVAQKEWVDVTDYGAKNNGEADALEAFRQAIEAAGGRPVYAPAGQYRLSGEIRPGVLVGDGMTETEIVFTGGGTCVNALRDRFGMEEHVELRGMTLTGSSAGGSSIGVIMGQTWRAVLSDLQVRAFGGVGIQFVNTRQWTEGTRLSDVVLRGNDTGLAFRVEGGDPSFGYQVMDGVWCEIGSDQRGVYVGEGARVYNSRFDRVVMAMGSASAESVGLDVDGRMDVGNYYHIIGESSTSPAPVGLRVGQDGTFAGQGTVDLQGTRTLVEPGGDYDFVPLSNRNRIDGFPVTRSAPVRRGIRVPTDPNGRLQIFVNSKQRNAGVEVIDGDSDEVLFRIQGGAVPRGETAMAVRVSDGAGSTLERVEVGQKDSGGKGFRALRVSN